MYISSCATESVHLKIFYLPLLVGVSPDVADAAGVDHIGIAAAEAGNFRGNREA